MNDRFAALRRTIAASPNDDEPYLVLADHLQQIGDPRGELIMLEHAGAGAREYFRDNREALLGPLAGLAPYLRGLRWKLGFVHQAILDFPLDEPTEVVRRVVQTALDAPAMALVHRLVLDVGSSDPDHTDDRERAVIGALSSKERPNLRWLKIAAIAGKISVKLIATALPNLEHLEIACQRISFGGVKSWGLRRLDVFTSAIPVASFKTVDWPVLERLSLTASIDGSLTELLSSVPALKRLAIRTAPANVEVIGSLFESGLARQLEGLLIDPTGKHEIEALQREASRFESLRLIEVTRGHDALITRFPREVEIVDPIGEMDEVEESGIVYEE